MKTYIRVFLFPFIAVLFASCGSGTTKSAADDKLGKLEVEIPEELKNNKEVVEFIKGMAEVSDEYALLMDEILEEAGEFVGKNKDELSMMEQIKLAKITGEVTVKSVSTLEKWGRYMEQRVSIKEQLNDGETKALEAVFARFEKRMEQIKEKHAAVFEKETE